MPWVQVPPLGPNKVDNFDTIGIETIGLILFVKMLDLQGFSNLCQIGFSFIVSVQRHIFMLLDTRFCLTHAAGYGSGTRR